MIIDKIIDILLIPVIALLDKLPAMDFVIDTAFIDNILFIFRAIGYFLPMKSIAAMLVISFSIVVFKIVISFIKTLWNLLPFT